VVGGQSGEGSDPGVTGPTRRNWGGGGFTKLYGFRCSLLTSIPYLVYFKCFVNHLRTEMGGLQDRPGLGGNSRQRDETMTLLIAYYSFHSPNAGSVLEDGGF